MAYSRGDSKNIIVGAAALFVADAPLSPTAATGTGSSSSSSYEPFVGLTETHWQTMLTL